VSQDLYSVGQVAQRLGLHVRTVRNYVRDGGLKAVRIGKQYRIAREDLEAFTGRPVTVSARDTGRRHRHVEVSSIVQIDAIAPDQANRMTTLLMGASKGPREDDEPLRVETIYDEERARLKIILVGSLKANAGLFELIALRLET
jgi:excisionase family DNA binding protein